MRNNSGDSKETRKESAEKKVMGKDKGKDQESHS